MNYLSSAKDLARFLQIISGIFGVGALLLCLFKIVTNSDESQGYIKKIKNILIALILIFTVTSIINLIQDYIKPDSDSNFMSIGKAPTNVEKILASTSFSDKDSKGRQILMIDGVKCVVTKKNQQLYYKYDKETGNLRIKTNDNVIGGISTFFSGLKKSNIYVDVIKKYNDVQGSWTKTANFTDEYAFKLSSSTAENTYTGRVTDDKGNYLVYEKINSDGTVDRSSSLGSNYSLSIGQLVAWTDSNGDLLISTKYYDDFTK